MTVRADDRKHAQPLTKPEGEDAVRVVGDAPDWITVSPEGEVEARPLRNTALGTYTVDVVTRSGQRKTITVEVAAPGADNARITPSYRPAYVRAGESNSGQRPVGDIESAGSVLKDQPLPKGTTYSTAYSGATVDAATGVVTLQAPLDAPAGTPINVPVRITFPDGTTTDVVAPFDVDAAEFQKFYTPAYAEGMGARPGQTVYVPQVAKELPEYTEYSLTDPDADYKGWDVSVNLETGELRATAPEGNAADIDVPVTVTFSDGTRKQISAHVAAHNGATLADQTAASSRYGSPVYQEDGSILVFPVGSLPEGARFQLDGLTALPVTVDPETGAIRISVPDDAPAGAGFDVPLKLVLPDGSVQEITVPVQTKSDATDHAVSWRPAVVTEGTTATVLPTDFPVGTTFALAASFDTPGWQASVDPATGAVTVARPGGEDDPFAAMIPVVVTFPDGSQRTVEIPATVVRGAAAATPVDYPTTDLRAGASTVLKPSVSGATFSLLKPMPGVRTEIDPGTGALSLVVLDSALPGVRDIPVVVTFPDGSQTITSARLNVLTAGGARTLAQGTKLDDVSAAVRTGTTTRVDLPTPAHAVEQPFSLGAFDAKGWTVELDAKGNALVVTAPEDAAGETITVPVTVTYDDGSQGSFGVRVEAEGASIRKSSEGTSSLGSSRPDLLPILLGLFALLGAGAKVLYDNREFFQTFLVWWK